MGHDHGHHHRRHFNRRRLACALVITFVTFIVELVGGIYTNSLALLSDAAHMFSHLFALGISLAAIIISLKPSNNDKTFGYYRAEILAAFINGLTLFFIVAAILYGAYERFKNPINIRATEMLVIAVIGLLVNFITALLLKSGSKEDINIKGAFLHAMGDMISSVGVVGAAILIHFTGLMVIDTLVSIGISAVIIYWAVMLIRDSSHVLLEGTPKKLDVKKIRGSIEGIIARPIEIHHVHIWELSTNIYAFTAHISIDTINQHEATQFLRDITGALSNLYNIQHTTIQFECRSCHNVDNAGETVDGLPCATHTGQRHGTDNHS